MSDYRFEGFLELPGLDTTANRHRNLCVQVQRSPQGNCRALLVDLEEFCGHGSTHVLAIDDLAASLEHVAAEIRRANTFRGDRHE